MEVRSKELDVISHLYTKTINSDTAEMKKIIMIDLYVYGTSQTTSL